METNGINQAVWINKQVLVTESKSTVQYQETHIGKKRKLHLTDGEESSALRIEGTYDQSLESQRHITMYESNATTHHHLISDDSITTDETYISRLNCSQQDIMGNLFGSDLEESDELIPVEIMKKKKKKEKRHRDRERQRKKELIDLEESSSSSESEDKHKKKDPRIGDRYQCDMSVLDNGEGDRNEFIGEKVWDPSNVNLEAVDKFLQDVQLRKPLINQFDFVPFFEYIPANSIVAQDKLLDWLMKFNYNFERTKKYLIEQKLDYTDRGFSVRRHWKTGEIKIFEKALKYMFEEEGEFDLEDVKRAMPSKPRNQICEFYYAWKHSKRFQAWKEESNHHINQSDCPDRGKLRKVARVDYNDQTSLVLFNINNRNSLKHRKKPLEDSKVIQTSNEGDYMVYGIIINAQIIDHESERKNCSKYITKKNARSDKFFLEYS